MNEQQYISGIAFLAFALGWAIACCIIGFLIDRYLLPIIRFIRRQFGMALIKLRRFARI